jgi:uncharacterized membrane protein
VKKFNDFLFSNLMTGVLVVIPVYIAAILLLKAVKSMMGLMRPIAALLPKWMPGAEFISLLLVLVVCLLVGMAMRTGMGRAIWEKFETSIFQKIPGYGLVRSLTQRMAGQDESSAWQPALVDIEEALVPGFIIETLEDGRFTVFVPSVPTPLAGAVYILTPERVHPLDVPFTQAIKTISRWGSGSKELVAAMGVQKGQVPASGDAS